MLSQVSSSRFCCGAIKRYTVLARGHQEGIPNLYRAIIGNMGMQWQWQRCHLPYYNVSVLSINFEAVI